MTTLGEQIRQVRRAQGLSQAELARRSGTARVGITRLEQGQRSPTVEEAQALAQVLGVTLGSLLGEAQDEAEEEGVELRFEVTVKLLSSREEKPIVQAVPEWLEREREKQSEIISKAAEKQGGTRLTGKDTVVPSRRKAKS